MNRRTFIRTLGLAAGSLLASPTLLPAGSLFAPTGSRRVNHVVLCLFAGGIRNLESVHKKDGNLMPYSLYGDEGISRDILPGMDMLPKALGKPLQASGTLFREFRFKSHRTIHYSAHTDIITGVYSKEMKLMKPLDYPTIFEYYRKHSPSYKSGLYAWWISDQAGPFPYLNYSSHPSYGPLYGANVLQPSSLLGLNIGSGPRNFHKEEMLAIDKLQQFLNHQFQSKSLHGGSVENTAEDTARIKDFVIQLISKHESGEWKDPWELGAAMNEDIMNVFVASQVIRAFQPELLVVNMQDSDIGHAIFTQYCNNIRKADFALAKLWETIQSTPGMADDTILIAMPEFGRNLKPNTLVDQYGRAAIDHTGDPTSQEIFCLVLGPEGVVNQQQVFKEERGETIDIVPTIADILGFGEYLPKDLLGGRVLEEVFV